MRDEAKEAALKKLKEDFKIAGVMNQLEEEMDTNPKVCGYCDRCSGNVTRLEGVYKCYCLGWGSRSWKAYWVKM